MKKRVGVLALQGAFNEHRHILESLDCEAVKVREVSDLENIQGLIIPGGEVTTIEKLLQQNNLGDRIKELAKENLPIFAICTGIILLSKNIEASNQYTLGLMDMTVKRNAFGGQVDKLETDLYIPAFGFKPVRTVFISAPYIKEVAPNVGILAEYDAKIVFVRQGNMIASAFHPELAGDYRVYKYFIGIIDEEMIK